MGAQYSRRQVLQAGIGTSAVVVAGCSGQLNSDGPNTDISRNRAFARTSFDGPNMVVHLEDDSTLTEVSLIGPTGERFESTSVPTGASAVRLTLFDLFSGQHYTPGEHTLVGIRDGEEVASMSMDLRPELSVTRVEPYTGGKPIPSNRANLLVTVDNVGTAPTWVYYLSYENAPYPAANYVPPDEVIVKGAEQNFRKPATEQETILSPDESTPFLGRHAPLRLSNAQSCDEQRLSMNIVVRTGVGPHRKQRIDVVLSGDKIQSSFQTSCSDINIELDGETENVEQ